LKSTRFPPPIPPLDASSLLRQYGLRPKKGLGQNFLQDPDALERILAAAEVRHADTVLEIGPGLGTLTRYLAAAAQEVIAVELDARLFPALESVLAPYDNVQLVQGDALAVDLAEWIRASGYLVVANIPYYITSALLRHLLENEKKPRRLVLTVQSEVAERICEGPGKMSLLALSVQVYGQPSIAARIPAGAFYPAPKVDSAVLVVEVFDSPRLPEHLLDIYFQLIKAGFSQKRKKLRNSLSAGMRLPPSEIERLFEAADIDPARRAETLSQDEWGRLCQSFQHG